MLEGVSQSGEAVGLETERLRSRVCPMIVCNELFVRGFVRRLVHQRAMTTDYLHLRTPLARGEDNR